MSHDTADTKLYGSTAFTGMVKAPAATSASGSVYMYPPDTKTSIGSVVYNCTSAKTAYFLHVPESTPCEIKIDDIGSQTAVAATYPIVGFSGNSAVQIKTLFGSGLRFATIGAATTVQSDDIGGATVEIDDVVVPKYKSTVLGGVYRLSKNMSYKIKEIGGDLTGAVNPRTVEFTYSDEMGDNTNSLSIGTVNWWKYQTVSVSAPTPAVAPRTVSLLDGHVNVRIAESDWSFGFDWTREDPNLSRCEITGAENATIPECGTIAITTVGKPGAKTVYPLFTCNVGCAALADAVAWPVTINGTPVEGDELSDGTAKYKIIRSETGIYLQANIVKGLMLILR